MSTQHTPGPWHRNIRAGGKYPTVFAGRNQHVAVATQQKDAAETEANIDLIAAAPELLAALRELEQCVRDLNEQSEINAADMLRRANRGHNDVLSGVNARAAIAKAEGQS